MQLTPHQPTFSLAELVPELADTNGRELAVTDVAVDSRKVVPGAVFFARSGARFDAGMVARDAAARGAAVVVTAHEETVQLDGVPVLRVRNFKAALGHAAAVCAGWPSRQLKLIGVTGTNGKTTVADLVARSLNQVRLCGLIGTLGSGYPDALESGLHTTPDIVAIQRDLARFQQDGAAAAVMEVSSHGIDQGRAEGLHFHAAAFTNLSRDHLDYHGSMSAYGATKARLFSEYRPGTVVINCDDTFGRELIEHHAGAAELIGYSLRVDAEHAALRATRVVDDGNGLTLEVSGEFGDVEVRSQLIGDFNAHNLLAALGLLLAAGMTAGEAASRLAAVPPVDGRMQWLGGRGQPRIVVDYAHTPDALRAALEALRPGVVGQLWVVFGCGGDRDPGKRPQMAAEAERHADRVVITDDNPRTEASAGILADILRGFAAPDGVLVQPDRATAIHDAIRSADPADTVLLAGKGHETYQERHGERRDFDDREHARAALARRASADTRHAGGRRDD
ncbi:MAG: UDP-N-acetylmuramoyl-L-alanyl-D-glutamate--2,6-diaminopimelate ligase [Pseudomonadota bacterium]